MRIQTKFFGVIDIKEDKIITFEKGLLGFEDFKKYTILYDIEEGKNSVISWLQSVEEPSLALPIINPLVVRADYNPIINDDLLVELGNLTEENLSLFLVMTVPKDIQKMTVNLKAPLIINSDEKKGMQMIVENQDYKVKYFIYDSFAKNKEDSAC